MDNSSLAAECNQQNFLNINTDADPDIAGTGVRVVYFRKWLDYVH